MGESALRCLDCLGKFGPPLQDLRCVVCSGVFRLRDLLLSERFPASGGTVVENLVLQAYYRGLEVADTFRRESAASSDTPPEQVDKSPIAKGDEPQPGSFPKSKPAKKEPVEEEEPASGSRKELEPLPRRKPDTNKVKKKKESVSPHRSPPKEGRSPRRSEKSSVGRTKSEDLPEGSDHAEEHSKKKKRKRRAERESLSRSRPRRSRPVTPPARTAEQVPRSPRRSPLRPRSPEGLPPPRSAPEQRWRGPIPSFQHRPGRRVTPPRHPEAANKGRKKRKQQELFNEFKDWKRSHGHY